MQNNKAVIYVRVSSKEQEEGHFSIPAQIDFLQHYAKEQGFNILEIYQESESAKQKGRPVFDRMIKFLKKQKNTCRLLVEKNDRLLRNEDDAALTINLATKTETEIHLVKDNMILSKRSTPHEIMIYTIMCATSSWYPRNLSLEVQKGMNKKAEFGYFPGRAPVGYINKRESKKVSHIIIDNEKAPWIKQAFELYATGRYSYQSLADKLAADGFKIATRKVQKNNIEVILKNPFYMGDFEYKGKRYYNGKHEPIISPELFYIVQKVRERGASPKRVKHDFLYSTLIKCEKCGSYLVGDLKKGKYLYFRCMHRGCTNTKSYLKEEHVDKKISEIINQIYISDECRNEILSLLKKSQEIDHEYRCQTLPILNEKITLLKSRLNKLYIDRLDGIIADEQYFKYKNEWTSELDELILNHSQLSKETDEFMQRAENLFELRQRAANWYYCQPNEKKRVFLKLLCSNLLWDGETLTVTINKAANLLFSSHLSNMVGVRGHTSNFDHNKNISKLITEINRPETVAFIHSLKTLLAA